MGRINGMEQSSELPAKVLAMYKAVIELISEGVDITNLRVSAITERAGIGKGTAYEYFDSKEDIVTCAVVYQIKIIFEWLREQFNARESFKEQMTFLLDEMSKKDGRHRCFMRFVHFLTDNSEFSRLIQEKALTEEFQKYMPTSVFTEMICEAVGKGELRDDLAVEYMVYIVYSHLLGYMMVMTCDRDLGVDTETMRGYVETGIMNELLAVRI